MSHKPLTEAQKTRAEKRAYQEFLKRQELYDPPPALDETDVLHENERVVKSLTGAVALLPAILAALMLAAILISADKTMRAFHDAVANKDALWGAWAVLVAALAVVMTEGGLVFAEFAAVRERLKKGLPRRVFTLKDFVRAIKVRIGIEEPLDWNEMPDATLTFYARFVFALVLVGNFYGVIIAYGGIDGFDWYALSTIQRVELVAFIAVGIAGALSLRFIGSQLAHWTYDLMEQRNAIIEREMFERWRQEQNELWQDIAPKVLAEAFHAEFVKKNNLPLDARSPYLLVAGEDDEGDPALSAIPFRTSPINSVERYEMDLKPPSGNGFHHDL